MRILDSKPQHQRLFHPMRRRQPEVNLAPLQLRPAPTARLWIRERVRWCERPARRTMLGAHARPHVDQRHSQKSRNRALHPLIAPMYATLREYLSIFTLTSEMNMNR
ncbi:hypothetical protein BDN70DRAFT_882177 [Pholiota conissans]|uniref:Uncharacterized protein n=1 Tax=Pholiota conissans TaxID=109636 RepID=A0A9P5YWV2_9AGAR|nr:hypothetical protein BDN70DRAFT_882177 [Pholiota conissans]